MIDGEIMQVEPENLVTEVLKLKHRDYRIVQICAESLRQVFVIRIRFLNYHLKILLKMVKSCMLLY